MWRLLHVNLRFTLLVAALALPLRYKRLENKSSNQTAEEPSAYEQRKHTGGAVLENQNDHNDVEGNEVDRCGHAGGGNSSVHYLVPVASSQQLQHVNTKQRQKDCRKREEPT